MGAVERGPQRNRRGRPETGMSVERAVKLLAARSQRAHSPMRACDGPLCCGVRLPREAFSSDQHRHCIACVDALYVRELEVMRANAETRAQKSFARRQRIIGRMQDLDEIARRRAGEREDEA